MCIVSRSLCIVLEIGQLNRNRVQQLKYKFNIFMYCIYCASIILANIPYTKVNYPKVTTKTNFFNICLSPHKKNCHTFFH